MYSEQLKFSIFEDNICWKISIVSKKLIIVLQDFEFYRLIIVYKSYRLTFNK